MNSGYQVQVEAVVCTDRLDDNFLVGTGVERAWNGGIQISGSQDCVVECSQRFGSSPDQNRSCAMSERANSLEIYDPLLSIIEPEDGYCYNYKLLVNISTVDLELKFPKCFCQFYVLFHKSPQQHWMSLTA